MTETPELGCVSLGWRAGVDLRYPAQETRRSLWLVEFGKEGTARLRSDPRGCIWSGHVDDAAFNDKGAQGKDGGRGWIYCWCRIHWRPLQTSKGTGPIASGCAAVEGEVWKALGTSSTCEVISGAWAVETQGLAR